MNCRLSGGETGLVAYWPFDESDLSDATGHGHGGAIGGLPGSLTYAALASLPGCAPVGVDEPPAPDATAQPMVIFPQPTRGQVTVRFELSREGPVMLDLFDVAGPRVGTLTSQHYQAGQHQLVTDIRAMDPTGLSDGMFFMRLKSEGRTVVRPLLLLR